MEFMFMPRCHGMPQGAYLAIFFTDKGAVPQPFFRFLHKKRL